MRTKRDDQRLTPTRQTAQADQGAFSGGSTDLTTKAAAWDGAQSSWRKGYDRGIRDAIDLITQLRAQYAPAAQGRQRFTIHDMERAFKGGLDLAREDIAKLPAERAS